MLAKTNPQFTQLISPGMLCARHLGQTFPALIEEGATGLYGSDDVEKEEMVCAKGCDFWDCREEAEAEMVVPAADANRGKEEGSLVWAFLVRFDDLDCPLESKEEMVALKGEVALIELLS